MFYLCIIVTLLQLSFFFLLKVKKNMIKCGNDITGLLFLLWMKMKELTAFTLKDPCLGQWKDIKNTEILNEEGRLVGMSPRKIQLEIIQQLRKKQNTIIKDIVFY
jgi:hypothetical protein